jgi:hypothetical protein
MSFTKTLMVVKGANAGLLFTLLEGFLDTNTKIIV